MFKRIVIASDGSEGAVRALSAAIRPARQHQATLDLVSVVETPQFPASVDEMAKVESALRQFYEAIARGAILQAQAGGVQLTTHLFTGRAVKAIVDFIKRERADLLAVGCFGHSSAYEHIIVSTTDRLVELAPCAVLVVK
jgi:nucleotide-binding universal stress UspA family protein